MRLDQSEGTQNEDAEKDGDDAEHGREKQDLRRKLMVVVHLFRHDVAGNRRRRAEADQHHAERGSAETDERGGRQGDCRDQHAAVDGAHHGVSRASPETLGPEIRAEREESKRRRKARKITEALRRGGHKRDLPDHERQAEQHADDKRIGDDGFEDALQRPGVQAVLAAAGEEGQDDDGIAVLRIADKSTQTVTVVARKEGYSDVTKVFTLTDLVCEAE